MGGKMSFWQSAFNNTQLSKPTSIFGLKLFVVIGIFIGASFVLLLFLLSFCFSSLCLRRRRRRHLQLSLPSPLPSSRKPLKLLLHDSTSEISKEILPISPKAPIFKEQYQLSLPLPPPPPTTIVEVTHLGWGHWYTLKELEVATNHFADENVIGEGGYGIVYRGALGDGSIVAVKNLMNNRGQAEKEFKVEVEAIGKVRHKNLVRLMGFCVEGAHRMLVYEYIDNGNLDQWLHGDVGEVSPLTWDIRMNILLSTAKGLAYLHEGLEPKVVHRDVKSSNILLDRQWNAKVSDFGLAKLICSERTYVTTRVMGTFGYVAPEYASTGMLNERSDVYSFGVLIMEVISGRAPVDYSKPLGEVNLVEWSKCMVGERKSEQVVDTKMREKPSPKALKRMLLVALRCVDPDALKRPKMGHVIHMLEVEDLLFREDCKPGREPAGKLDRYNPSEEGSFGRNNHQSGWR